MPTAADKTGLNPTPTEKENTIESMARALVGRQRRIILQHPGIPRRTVIESIPKPDPFQKPFLLFGADIEIAQDNHGRAVPFIRHCNQLLLAKLRPLHPRLQMYSCNVQRFASHPKPRQNSWPFTLLQEQLYPQTLFCVNLHKRLLNCNAGSANEVVCFPKLLDGRSLHTLLQCKKIWRPSSNLSHNNRNLISTCKSFGRLSRDRSACDVPRQDFQRHPRRY